MATIPFDVTAFRTMFPAFSNTTTYPTITLQSYWDMATAYINDKTAGYYCGGWVLKQQVLALNLMTAHLAALFVLIASGQTPGIEISATIDKISVSMEPPPAKNQWQYWLQTTPYGAQLLALLQIAAAGGRFYNPAAVFTAFRR